MSVPSPIRHHLTLLLSTLALLAGAPAHAQDERLTVVSWNVESGDANATVLARRIRDYQGVDLWGLSEVESNAWLSLFETAAEDGENADFRRVLGTTGGGDRLAILYNADRFELVRSFELADINIGGRVRAPLIAQLRLRTTGDELLFMVNHLYRGSSEGRHQQARMLNAWAAQQTPPVVAVGDYNFDWSVTAGETDHDLGFDRLTEGGVFVWVRPATLVRTQCSEGSSGSGGSVLDFVFVANAARTWQATSTIDTAPGDCPDPGNQQSDHRPVRAEFSLRAVPPSPAPTREELLRRIEALEQQLRELRALIERLPPG